MKREIMSEMGNTVLTVQEEGGRVMLEVTPLELGTTSARVFLDDTGQKRLMDRLVEMLPLDMTLLALNKKFDKDLDKKISELPSIQPINVDLKNPDPVPFTDALGVEFGCNDE